MTENTSPSESENRPPVTRLAYLSLAFGFLSLLAAALSFLPFEQKGPHGIPYALAAAVLGLGLAGGLTLLTSIVTLFRIGLAGRELRGGKHVAAALALLAVAVFFLFGHLFWWNW